MRHPAAAQGRVLRPDLVGVDSLLASASRSASASASRRSTSRRWSRCGCTRWPSRRQHLRPQAVRARPVGLEPRRRAVRRGRAARRRLQRRARRQGRRRRAARPPRRRRDLVRRLHADREVHPRARPARTASASRRWAARRTTRSSSPTRIWTSPPTSSPRAGFGSAGQRCMAIAVAVAVGDAADPLVEKLRERARGSRSARAGPGSRDGPGRDAARPRTASRATSARASRPGRDAVVDGRGSTSRAMRTGFSSARRCSTTSPTEMTSTPTRSSAPSWASSASRRSTTPSTSSTRTPYANGAAIFTTTAAPRASSSAEIEVGMVGINVPIPVPMAFHTFGGWKSSLFGERGRPRAATA